MSNADKRTVSTDALETLGTFIHSGEKRDAIHLAVIPVQAAQRLSPGEHVQIAEGTWAHRAPIGQGLGIVDPFLTQIVEPDQWFWLVIYPRQITSLRHVWTHPAFDNQEIEQALPQPTAAQLKQTGALIDGELQRAISTVQQIANDIGAGYDELMDAADSHVKGGDYWIEGGRFEGEYIDGETFWPAYNLIRGTEEPDHGSFLACSC